MLATALFRAGKPGSHHLRPTGIGLSYPDKFRYARIPLRSDYGVAGRDQRFQDRQPDMGDVINLNRYRKLRAKGDAERRAEENRVKFGRTKAEKANDRREEERRDDDLAGKQRDNDLGDSEAPDAS
jgi:hypothetical protein